MNPAPDPVSGSPARLAGLDALYAPRSIAVVGVNDNERNLGYGILRSLDNGGYGGSVHPISRRLPTIRGLETRPSIAELDVPPDQVVVALPAAAVNDVVEECIDAGVGSVMVLSSGFAETGEVELQQRLAAMADGTPVRIGGPNCAGYTNFVDAIMCSAPLPFGPDAPRPRVGPIGVVSQSGGIGFYLMRKLAAADMGLNWQISTGNEVDVDVADAVSYLLEKPIVEVVLCFFETVSRVDRFLAAVERAAELDKPLVALKSARTDASRRAAESHTAALVGSGAVFDAVCRQYGVHVVHSFDELANLGRIFANGRRAHGSRVGIITQTGGTGVLLADALTTVGLSVPELSDADQQSLHDAIDTKIVGSVRNPIDVGTAGGDTFTNAVRWIAQGSQLDVAVPVFTHDALALADSVLDLYESTTAPIAALSTGHIESLVRHELPVFTDPKALATALAALVAQSNRASVEAGVATPPMDDSRVDAVRDVLRRVPDREHLLLEHDAAEVLRIAGVPVAESVLARTPAEAVAAAAGFSGPVAMKVVSYGIAHKSDVGGVLLGVEGSDAVQRAFDTLTSRASSMGSTTEGVLVQPMIPARVELACGLERDDVFGPMVVVSLGGTLIEIVAESAMLRPPFTQAQARSCIASMCEGRLVASRRGLGTDDVDAVAGVMRALGDLALAVPEIVSVDVNPLRVTDGAVCAVDALIVLGR